MDYTTEQLKGILAEHAEWMADNSKGQYANLRGANLSYADLRDANLRGANLRDANLRGADLRGVDLKDVDLRYADLRDANLRGVDLKDVDLGYADLKGADLRGVDLRYADLKGADLRGVDLDFSSGIPLWCGGACFKCDAKLIQQVLAHLCTLDCKDKQWVALRKVNKPFAKKSHRAYDLGLIKQKKG